MVLITGSQYLVPVTHGRVEGLDRRLSLLVVSVCGPACEIPGCLGGSEVRWLMSRQACRLLIFIGALRAELRAAALAEDPQLQFNVGPVNVEFTPTTRHEGGGKAGIRFWVVEAGASANVANESTQKVTLALTPVTASGDPWQVADEVEERPP